jgi:hypothetical protein
LVVQNKIIIKLIIIIIIIIRTTTTTTTTTRTIVIQTICPISRILFQYFEENVAYRGREITSSKTCHVIISLFFA